MAVESSKMTRNQVHQKLKENFQALCTRCPQLTDRKDSLDDSLTNLQWLWNLNVNIANPVDGGSRNGGYSRNGNQELYRNGSSTIFVPNRRQEHRPHRSVGGRSRQSKSSASYSKANSNFRSTAPVSSSSGQHKYITTVNVDPSMGIRASPSSKGGQKYRKQVDIVKTSPQKSDEEKANIFLNKPHTTSLDEFEFEEKPDISKLNFQSSKNDSYPLLSDAAFYPSVSTSDHNSCKIITPSSVTVLNQGDLELKPLYSLPTLIHLALQNAPNGRMCLSSICQWIRENCDFYRTSNDNSWQKSVEKTLKQNESFVKVPKKKSHTRKTQWEIAENLNQSTEDFFGGLPFAKIRGLSALSFQSPASRGLFGNGSATTTAMNLFNRKRKQPMPQKIVRLRNQHKRRRQNNGNSSDLSTLLDQLDESNPLRDQAPEVGSLKGDFNWTTIFDEFTSDNLLSEAHLPGSHSRASSSPLVSPNPLSDSAASSFFNLAFGNLASTRFQSNRSQAASESSDSSSQIGANNENLNLFAQSDDFGASSSYDVDDSSPAQDEMDKLLNGDSLFQSITDMSNDDVIIDGLDGNVGSISIDEFFQGATGLDLTVQGHQITAPPHWAPVGTDLETILCESQDSNLSASNSSSGASR